jgi:hypothetical protein
MSDLSDLHGIFTDSLRWNAETGVLGVGVFNPETGDREVREIPLGNVATFVVDLATRERGYGLIKVGVYDMKLTPVGSPPPPRPDDEEFRPALGCWVWNPALGELRLEVCSAIFRTVVANVWDQAKFAPEAIRGLQPVVRFASVDVPVKSVNKTFFGPVVQIVGWFERNDVPGWKERTPTVPPPKAPPLLAASSTPAPVVMAPSRAKLKPPRGAAKPGPGKPGLGKPGPDDPIDDILGGDSIPWK